MIINHQEDASLWVLYLKFFNLNFKIHYAFAVHAHPKTLHISSHQLRFSPTKIIIKNKNLISNPLLTPL